jgi:hypothetical protein
LKKGAKTAKSKAIACTFRPFLATYFIFESLYFSSVFSHLFHFWKRGQKQQKSKAIAFTFRPFLATYFIFEKEAKNDKRVRL